MNYRRLGKSGLKLSALSFGSWVTFDHQLDDSRAAECMKTAYDAGVNFFDNAEAYANGQSEIIMGRVLKKMGWGRDTFCVSSKVFWGGQLPTQKGLSAKHVTDACHAALKRFQLDYLDLYFCHRPDPETPILETMRAMHNLILQGKVLYWGTSEWSAKELQVAYLIAEKYQLTPPTMEQPEYNLFHRDRLEKEYAPIFKEYGLGTTIWSPLASGILTGKYNDGVPDGSRMSLPQYGFLKDQLVSSEGQKRVEKTRALTKIATDLGTTVTKLALAWCLKNPNVSTVILGASKVAQLKENLEAIQIEPKLTPEVLKKIEKVVANRPSKK
jgi:voltage-dependent potassium channel beta subunit